MSPSEFPAPPLLEHLLFESPWKPALFLLALAVALFLLGGRLEKNIVQRTAFIVGGAAFIVVILAALVETDREQMSRRTRELVAAMKDPFDLQKFISLSTPEATMMNMPKASLIRIAEQAANLVRVTDAYVTQLNVAQDSATRGRTLVVVMGRLTERKSGPASGPPGGGGGGGFKAQATIHWTHAPDAGWIVERVDRVKLNDQDAEAILRSTGLR